MKTKEQEVVHYYALCNKLKDTIRTGWKNWGVERSRVESVAEHVFGAQMLAIAMKSEYDYKIDIMKVIYLLAIHDVTEAIIGDLTPFEITDGDKGKLEARAIHEVFGGLLGKDEIESLLHEFNTQSTEEARFARQCDKLECDLQCKIYDEEGRVDLSNQNENVAMRNPQIRTLIESGASWSTMWMKFSQENASYDDNFRAVSNYAMSNNIKLG